MDIKIRFLLVIGVSVFLAIAVFVIVLVSLYHRAAGYGPCTRTFLEYGAAMQPTLMAKDDICVDTARYATNDPRPGDIVVFEPSPGLGTAPFVKRIVAIPGDAFEMRDGRVFRNGLQVDERYILGPADYALEVRDYDIFADGIPLDPRKAVIPPRKSWTAANRIPIDCYLVLGDNRNNSNDSHLWGCTRREQFIGRATSIIWPLGRERGLLVPQSGG